MIELINCLEELGYRGMMGILRAKMHGVITSNEYYSIKEYAHVVLGVNRDWWKVLIFSR